MATFPNFGAVSPWQQVQNINMANAGMPQWAQLNPQAINQVANQRRQAVMAGAGNNPFEKAEFSRVASNVYNDTRNSETSRVNYMRNAYFGTPTADSQWQAAQQWRANMYGQQQGMRNWDEWLNPNTGYIPTLGAPAAAAGMYFLQSLLPQKPPPASQIGGSVGQGIGNAFNGLGGY